jgi:hypothetical protein
MYLAPIFRLKYVFLIKQLESPPQRTNGAPRGGAPHSLRTPTLGTFIGI